MKHIIIQYEMNKTDLQTVLDALEYLSNDEQIAEEAITLLQAAIAAPEKPTDEQGFKAGGTPMELNQANLEKVLNEIVASGKDIRAYPRYASPAEEKAYEDGFLAGNQAAVEAKVTKFMDSYTRVWVGLTDEEWEPLYDKFAKHQEYGAFVSGWGDFAKAIEAKLKEKNT